MKKVAFFVEGFTEQFFLKELLKSIFSEKEIAVECKRFKGGNNIALTATIVSQEVPTEETKCFITIDNCTGEGNVKSYINARRESLINAGFSRIIGIRDVYPNIKREEIPFLRTKLLYGLPQKDLPTIFLLIVMEVEALFIAEYTHFEKIKPSINLQRVIAETGINPSVMNTEFIDEAAIKLNEIYQLGGESYEKTHDSIKRTINALSLEDMYFNLPSRIPCFKELIDIIDSLIEQ